MNGSGIKNPILFRLLPRAFPNNNPQSGESMIDCDGTDGHGTNAMDAAAMMLGDGSIVEPAAILFRSAS